MNTLPTRLAAFGLLAALVAAAPAAQTYTLPTSVVSAGGTRAAGNWYSLDGSVHYTAGFSSNATYALGTGFWYQAPTLAAPRSAFVEAVPPLALAVPGSPVAPGAALPVAATFTLGPDAPEAFQYWTEVTLPDGTVLGPLAGPGTALVTPGTVVTLAFRQGVPASARPGAYAYTMYAGTYPDAVLAAHAVAFTVAAPPTLGRRAAPARAVRDGSRDAADASDGGREADRRGTGRLARAPASEAVATGEGWLAYDGEGRPLVPGAVTDLRADVDEAGAEAAASAVATASGLGSAGVPTALTLAPAYPNPFSSRATLRFGLPAAAHVRLAVYDALGRRVAVLLDGEQAAGWHEAVLDGSGLAGGLYVARLEAGAAAQTQRLTLVRQR
jgi:hypothetical protein